MMRGSAVAEQRTHNAQVGGSIPPPATTQGRVAQLEERRTDNSPVGGSIPSPTTTWYRSPRLRAWLTWIELWLIALLLTG